MKNVGDVFNEMSDLIYVSQQEISEHYSSVKLIILLHDKYYEDIKEYVVSFYCKELSAEAKSKEKDKMVGAFYGIPFYVVKDLEVPYMILQEKYRGVFDV